MSAGAERTFSGPPRSKRWLLVGAAAATLGALAMLLFQQKEPAVPPMPNPNGYDDFLAAFQMIVPNEARSKTQTLADLRIVLAQNSNALQRIRTGLGKECRMPLPSPKEMQPGT